MSEDTFYSDLAEAYENRRPIGYEDENLIDYQEHQWEQDDDR